MRESEVPGCDCCGASRGGLWALMPLKAEDNAQEEDVTGMWQTAAGYINLC